MYHPFELELSQLKSSKIKIESLEVESLDDEITEKITGGCYSYTLALNEGGQPNITHASFEQGGSDNTSILLGESSEGPRF